MQYCTVASKTPLRKAFGYILAILGFILNFVFSLDMWMIVVLTLIMFQQDGPARDLNYTILLNIVFCQSLKRFMIRKRPG